MMGCKNEPVKNIVVEDYHLVLQKSENLKFHPIDYCTGVTRNLIYILGDVLNFYRYHDCARVSFIIFAFLLSFLLSSI